MSHLFSGHEPRLIPSNKSDEDRATSSFLAVLIHVDEFRRVLMRSVGRSVRKSGNDFNAELHPSFRGKYSETDIPDGMIVHEKSGDTWKAAIEVKVKSNDLDLPQLERYLRKAREHKLSALITISNEMCIAPDKPPLRLKTSDRKLRSINHYHWSWSYIRHKAIQLLELDDIADSNQRYVLNEFVRFLQDPSTGIEGFRQMGPSWKELVDDLKHGVTDTPQEVFEDAVSDWHQECADLAFQLAACLGRPVSQVVPSAISTRESRLDEDVAHLRKHGDLQAEFDIGDGKNTLRVCLDIDRRALSVSKAYDLPTNVKTPYKRIEHFIRRVAGPEEEAEDGQHEGMRISAKWPYVKDLTSTTLFDAMQDVANGDLQQNRLVNTDKDTIQYVELQYMPPKVATKISSRKKVVELLEQSVAHFCDHYLDI